MQTFQSRHGMRPTGQVDRATIQMMNMSAPTCGLAQLRISLVRARELAAQIGNVERYVLVNIPAFALEAVDRASVAQRHRVIAGRAERQTPGVKAMIKNINFFPFWHVPESVAHLDLIPKMRKEPDYMAKEKIRALKTYKGEEVPLETIDWNSEQAKTYKFQQDPGPQNALGLVRIDMPNEHTVYMHDTPMKQLFGQRGRAYSAGCVRVDGVFDLVAWILKDVPSMDRAQIDVILRDGQPVDIPLPRPVPVHFVYQTAWAIARRPRRFPPRPLWPRRHQGHPRRLRQRRPAPDRAGAGALTSANGDRRPSALALLMARPHCLPFGPSENENSLRPGARRSSLVGRIRPQAVIRRSAHSP